MRILAAVVILVGMASSQVITCGLPGVSANQSCFNTSTSPVPLPNPIPSWGPNSTTAAGGNPYLVQTVGNLTGAGTCVTPSDFGRQICRATDITFFGIGQWGFVDNGEPNLFSAEDSSGNFTLILKANGGQRYFIHCDSNGSCTPILGSLSGGVNFSAIFDHSSPTTVYSLEGAGKTVINQYTLSVACSGIPLACTGSLGTATQLYDMASVNCIRNSYNGNTGFVGGANVGLFTNSLDDTTFSISYNDDGQIGQWGRWIASWRKSYGSSGNCDILEAQTQKYRNNAGTQGVVSITPPVFAADKFSLHEGYSALTNGYALLSPATNSYTVGEYYTQNYMWQIGTANLVHAGYPSPLPTSGNSINGTITSGAFTSGETVTQALTGASGTIVTPSGGVAGFMSAASSVLQLGTITGSPDSTHDWVGGTSVAHFTPVAVPVLNPTNGNNGLSGHVANGYLGIVVGKNGVYSSYANPFSPLTNTTPNAGICNDVHQSWNHGNASDGYPPLMSGQDAAGAFANLAQLQTAGSAAVCPPPPVSPSFTGIPAYYDEDYFTNIGSGSVLRTNHTFNSGWSWVFDVQNAVGDQSSSGKWHAFPTDAWGQFGSTAGNAECNIGGPDWSKNDSTDVITGTGFGSFIMPGTGNNGHYVYHVQSCSGTCTTGATAPTWPQSSTPNTTVVDNTITWETYPDAHNAAVSAVNNCRAEIMLVRDFEITRAGVSGNNTAQGNIVRK